MTDHPWTQENLDAYLANGLTTNERSDLERHVAECAECAQALQAARKLETTMKTLFADAPPPAGLADRAVTRLRRTPIRRRTWVRYAIGAAAVLVIGLVGAAVQAVVDGAHTKLVTVGQKMRSLGQSEGAPIMVDESFHVIKGKIAKESDTDIQFMTKRLDDGRVPGLVNPNGTVGILNFGPGVNQPPMPGMMGGGMPGGMGGMMASGSVGADKLRVLSVNGIAMDPKKILESGYGQRKAEEEFRVDLAGKPYSGFLALDNSLSMNVPPQSTPPDHFGRAGEKAREKTEYGPPVPPLSIAEANTKNLHIFEKNEPKDGPPPPASPPAPKPSSPAIAVVQPKPGEPPPEPTIGRKIIRTGDMEFEVESFDGAVAGIGNLLGAVKGSFIATVNSDKLQNGKMKGAVVVRMPPQFLDKFILDVRGALGKNSELKSQRIGSADITKQFTDTESRLRAARAMEDRFIAIIKTGKGEVKDLIAAERELGVWRTKIEEMEGEIRYYGNQVSLSTLTIHLTEKEIATPFALVTTESVHMRLEVEDVSKALDSALKAVDQFKGRVVKSESKQHKAGRVEAFLHAEIPAAGKESFRQALRKLGIVSADESTQKTQSEGGSGNPGKLAAQTKDVVFEVSLNNIVDIPARNSVLLDLASADVSAAYARIEAFVLKKGQMRAAGKTEPDKQRVSASLEFSVPNEHKDEADKLIAAVGPVLKQVNVQTPNTEVATEQKFGFKLNLYSVALIAPRETVKMTIEVDDVRLRASEIEAMGKASKGQAFRGQFVQNPQGRTSIDVGLRVPLAAADPLVAHFLKIGKVIEQDEARNANVPDNDLATAAVLVKLTGSASIVANDQTLSTQLREGLSLAFWLLAKCLVFIVIGLCGVLPWIAVIWIGVKVVMWIAGPRQPSVVAVKSVEAAPKPEGGEQKPAGGA